MARNILRDAAFCAILVFGLPISPTALAQPPDFVQQNQGKGKDKDKHEQGQRKDKPQKEQKAPKPDLSVNLQFNSRQRDTVRDYYGDMYRKGKCPPGLAKKNNGCQPPGQAKKWRRGYPLGSDISFYELDRGLLSILGAAPSGYKYVRVGSDILMLAIGTNMVVDAIENLGGF